MGHDHGRDEIGRLSRRYVAYIKASTGFKDKIAIFAGAHEAGCSEAVANPAMPVAMLRDFCNLGARLLRDYSRKGCGTIGTKTRAPGVRH